MLFDPAYYLTIFCLLILSRSQIISLAAALIISPILKIAKDLHDQISQTLGFV